MPIVEEVTEEGEQPEKDSPSRPKRGKVFALIVFVFFLVLGILVLRTKTYLDRSLTDLRSADGRINILLLGAGGSEGQVTDLTDTILFISLIPDQGGVVMISLPRDIWIPSWRAKLNTIYHYGNEKESGSGLAAAKSVVVELLDQPIHYAVLVEFNDLVGLVNLLEGVEIEVERELDDFKYPIPGKENDDCGGDPEFACRYEHLHFEAGWQKMDGERVLKYVRSRFAEGEEGTDFARSRRQQLLLFALKEKLLSPTIISNPQKIVQLIKLADQFLERDIPPAHYPGFLVFAWRLRGAEIKSYSLEEFLITPPRLVRYDYQWVLVPRQETWDEIQEYVVCLLAGGACQK